jgi:CrcB protein
MIATLQHILLAGLGKIGNWFTSTDAAVRAPIAVSLGAIPGALSRYYVTVWSAHWFGTGFPVGTFLINLTGAMIMGFFVTYTLERTITSPDLRLLVATGFLGSYTTFSTYALDTMNLVQSGNYLKSLLYWVGSATLGVMCLVLGGAIARRLG